MKFILKIKHKKHDTNNRYKNIETGFDSRSEILCNIVLFYDIVIDVMQWAYKPLIFRMFSSKFFTMTVIQVTDRNLNVNYDKDRSVLISVSSALCR